MSGQGRRAIQDCKPHKAYGGDRKDNGREKRPRISSGDGELQAKRGHVSFTDRLGEGGYYVDGEGSDQIQEFGCSYVLIEKAPGPRK